MEKYNQIQYVIGKDDLREVLLEIIERYLNNQKDEELLPLKKVMEMLDVKDCTLWRWDKIGLLKKVTIGGKVYYRRSDIAKMMEESR